MKSIIFLVAVLFLINAHISWGFADASVANPPSIGIAAPSDSSTQLSPQQQYFKSWIGLKFIFLRKALNDNPNQNYKYWSILNPSPDQSNEFITNTTDDSGNSFTELTYSKFVGKIINCISYDGHSVIFHVPDYGMDITYIPDAFQVADIAPLRELSEARSRWLGKTVYLPIGNPASVIHAWSNDTQADQETSYMSDQDESFKIVDIVWGDKLNNPLWFILQNRKGVRVGFIEGGVDQMNKVLSTDYTAILMGEALQTPSQLFKFQSLADETTKYHWSQRAWDAISMGQVYIGMLSAQVKMSIGEPNSINTDEYADGVHQQWIYDHMYVYTENGKVTAIQIRP